MKGVRVMCVFPKRCNGVDELKYIFSLMQKEVQNVIDITKNTPDIHNVVVFESAVTANFGIGSDFLCIIYSG